jgi:NTP pyrophosphatase (non-canonical NTP hydrolase)
MRTEVYNEIALQFIETGTSDETLFTGFASEAGEVMKDRMKEVRKGLTRDTEILDELSDVLWYITVIANKRGKTLKDLMKHNINKLEVRILENK